MQWIRGRLSRTLKRVYRQVACWAVGGLMRARISSSSAGMIRIRFDGWLGAFSPAAPAGHPIEIAPQI
jgi:hypothetical protein